MPVYRLSGLPQPTRRIFHFFALMAVCLLTSLAPSHLPLVFATEGGVGGLVWNDLNSNGLHDSGESGIPSIQLTLHRADHSVVANAVTDANGSYLFSLRPEGGVQYYLKVNPDELLENKRYAITTQSAHSTFDQIAGTTIPFTIEEWLYDQTQDLGLIQVPECPAAYDIMTVLDGSAIVSGQGNQFKFMRNFVRVFSRAFDIARPVAHLGVVQFNGAATKTPSRSQVEIGLREIFNRLDFIHKVEGIPFRNLNEKGESLFLSTNIWEGINLARKQFAAQERTSIPQVIVLVTDGWHTHTSKNPIDLANQLKQDDKIIFVVKLSDDPTSSADIRQLSLNYAKGIASQPLSIYLYENMGYQTNLMSIMVDLVQKICSLPSTADGSPLQNYYLVHTPTLSWDSVTWARNYQIEISDTQRFESPTIQSEILSSENLNFTTDFLEDGIYFWRVRAGLTIDSWGGWSSPERFEVHASQ